MNRPIWCRMKSYIQPFERVLAERELAVLAGAKLGAEVAGWRPVDSKASATSLAQNLAYWEAVENRHRRTSPTHTLQVLREATVNVVRNGVTVHEVAELVPFGEEVPLPNRRCLRYATHGMHEYRGKFFPQLVRAVVNIAGVPTAGVIADPMCGSGTTAVETVLDGRTAIGLDMNPLSVLIASTKCQLLSAKPSDLIRAYDEIQVVLTGPKRTSGEGRPYLERLPVADQEYLRGWFSEQVLTDLNRVAAAIERQRRIHGKALATVALSNILRRVSWQKEDDLRVRRAVRNDADVDAVTEFLAEFGRATRMLLAFLYQDHGGKRGRFEIQQGDARNVEAVWSAWLGKADAVITSPPYATALPYLDTDRLSLCYLQLLGRPLHRQYDQQMIGNREVTDRQRRNCWDSYVARRRELPRSITELVDGLQGRVEAHAADVGFRRRNLPSLLGKYFMDMREVLLGTKRLLRPGRSAFVVVGGNHTVIGGQRVSIDTATLLTDLAASVGFHHRRSLPMEMLVSRDIFRRNGGECESLIELSVPHQS